MKSCRMRPVSYSKTATMRPLPVERALKTDILTVLALYQKYYSNTNQQRPTM